MKYNVDEKIKDYYDNASIGKIRDFIFGNARVDIAWNTIKTTVEKPTEILEIGCGIGAMCNRCNLRWPDAHIIGIDISAKSIDIAQKLFESKNCKFYSQLPKEHDNRKKFDLIFLIDVIEHVEKAQRQQLFSFIENNLSENGMLMLAFPTPHMLDINRKYYPEKLQPIEENVYISDLQEISKAINKPLVLYKEVFVWEKRDYAHAIFSEQLLDIIEKPVALREQVRKKLRSLHRKAKETNSTEIRNEIVLRKLNINISNP